MEFLMDIWQFILNLINGIAYYTVFFFGAQAAFTHIFKAVLIAQIVLLVYTVLRPKRWRWIALFISEGVFLMGALGLLGVGFSQDSISYVGYGATSAVIGFFVLMLTRGGSLREKRPKG